MTERTPEIDAEIVERLATGEPMTVICRDEHMPSDRAVRYWQEQDAEFASAIARARLSGFDVLASQCLEIADTQEMGETVTVDEAGNETVKREDMLGHRKLRIETRLKLLAKWDPKRYGDMIKHAGPDGEQPVQAIVSFVKTDAPNAD